jgi:hypothetical protein
MRTAEDITAAIIGSEKTIFELMSEDEQNDFELVCEVSKSVYFSLVSRRWEPMNHQSVMISILSKFQKLTH